MESKIPEHVSHRHLIRAVYRVEARVKRLGLLKSFMAGALVVLVLLAAIVGGLTAHAVSWPQIRQPPVLVVPMIPPPPPPSHLQPAPPHA